MNTEEGIAADNIEGGEPQPKIDKKTMLTGKVVRTTLAGALVDIGQDQPAMLHISRMKKDPINKVEDVLEVGQTVEVWVRRVDKETGRVELTMIEPLALEWREIKTGLVLSGRVTRLEKFGAFVEIGAERPGLVHISELTHGYIGSPDEIVKEGEEVEVKVIGVNRRKKRIRLSMKALIELPKQRRKKEEVQQEEELDDRPVPTAMEMALREAMERNKPSEEPVTPSQAKRASPSKKQAELDEILERTLEREPQTK